MSESRSGLVGARRAALRRAGRVKRWVVGGVVALTGVFSAVTENALPASHSNKAKAVPSAPPAPPPDLGAEQLREQAPTLAPPAAPPAASFASSGTVSGAS
jgi:hypothetical protein